MGLNLTLLVWALPVIPFVGSAATLFAATRPRLGIQQGSRVSSSAGSPCPAYAQFVGLTQHDLYHAGQIAHLLAVARRAGGRADEPGAAPGRGRT